MIISQRRVVIGIPLPTQGTTEKVYYEVDLFPMFKDVGVPSTPISCKVYKLSDGSDVTGSCSTGTPTLNGFLFTTSLIQNISKDIQYRIVGEITIGVQLLSFYIDVMGEL